MILKITRVTCQEVAPLSGRRHGIEHAQSLKELTDEDEVTEPETFPISRIPVRGARSVVMTPDWCNGSGNVQSHLI